jgi:drug/metabolite transporter (DMT)-like permease
MSQGDLYAILAGLVWSFCVILMRISGSQIPPVALTLFKSFVAVLFFAVLLPFLREPYFQDLSARDYGRLAVSAVLGITIADTMYVAALNRLGASLQALASCTYAPSMAAIGFLLFGELLGPWEILGGSLVVAGVAVGIRPTAQEHTPRNLLVGVLLAAGAHIIMAVGILMVRDIFTDTSVVWVSGYRFLIATISLAGLALIKWPLREVFMGFTRPDTWKLMIPMSFFGPFLATIFWTAGFKHLPAGRAAIYNQLSTVFIIVLAVILLKERLTRRKTIAVALAIAGAILVGLQR